MSHNEGMPTLSDWQEIILSVLFLLSSNLSILGSSSIVYKVLRNRGDTSPYDRLMLGLSMMDVLASIGFAMVPFGAPKEISTRIWAIGTRASCTFLGFLFQLGVGANLYNAMLSFYFLLTIRFKVPRRDFARKYEGWLHCIPIGFSVITASVGAFMGVFSELDVGMGCWVNDYPIGCVSHKDCTSDEMGLIYAAVPVAFTFSAITTNNSLVYLAVRKAFRKAESTETERQIRQKLQKREVATQGFLYVAAFLICIWPVGAIRFIEGYYSERLLQGQIDKQINWLLVVQSICFRFKAF